MESYTKVPNILLLDENLTLEEKYFLIVLKSFDHKNSDIVFPTYKTIMKLCSTKRQEKISKLIKSLKEKRYLDISKVGKHNQYKIINKNLSINENNEVFNRGIDNITNSNNRNHNCSENRRGKVSKSRTEKEQYKNKKEKYIDIFNYWNSKNINNEKDFNMKIINSIEKALSKYSLEEIKSGIDNYNVIYHSDYYYNYKWNLSSFLFRDNGINRFTEYGDIWTKYKGDALDKEQLDEIDYESYID